MYIFSILFPYKILSICKNWYNKLFTLWLKNFLGHVGFKSLIKKPCSLQGGGQRNISIGDNTTIDSYSVLGCWSNYRGYSFPNSSITIGNNCYIGAYNHISACNGITIGDGLLTGRFVIISDNAHGGLSFEESNISPANRELKSKGKIVIGNNVWLCDKVAVLSGVTIGNNVIVAANAVVTHNIPDNCLVAGIPAKIIKKLV